MTKSKCAESSIAVPLIFVIHLVNGVQFLNATRAAVFPAIVILPLTRM